MTKSELVESCNRFNFEACDQTQKAFKIARELTKWCGSFDGGTIPAVVLHVTYGSVQIEIGPFIVFDSDCDGRDELSFDSCIEKYKKEIEYFSAWGDR